MYELAACESEIEKIREWAQLIAGNYEYLVDDVIYSIMHYMEF